MSKLIAVFLLIAAFAAPALAQRDHRNLSPEDQARFDSYYSRWQQARDRNDRDQVRSMEQRMQDLYARYGIPADTPYWRVASNGREEGRDPYERWHGRLSGEDQSRFDSYYSRWLEYRRTNNGGQVGSMEQRMYELYDRYHIPHDVPFDRIANEGRR